DNSRGDCKCSDDVNHGSVNSIGNQTDNNNEDHKKAAEPASGSATPGDDHGSHRSPPPSYSATAAAYIGSEDKSDLSSNRSPHPRGTDTTGEEENTAQEENAGVGTGLVLEEEDSAGLAREPGVEEVDRSGATIGMAVGRHGAKAGGKRKEHGRRRRSSSLETAAPAPAGAAVVVAGPTSRPAAGAAVPAVGDGARGNEQARRTRSGGDDPRLRERPFGDERINGKPRDDHSQGDLQPRHGHDTAAAAALTTSVSDEAATAPPARATRSVAAAAGAG
ncbi:unnamed protein product, partial [Scytosiphon promiscuus]